MEKIFLKELLIFTIPLFWALAWWLVSFFFTGLHKEIGADAHGHVEMEGMHPASAGAEHGHEALPGNTGTLLWGELIGLGTVPFSVWASLALFIYGWLGLAFYFGFESWLGVAGWRGAALSFFPAFIGSLLLTGLAVRPIKPFYRDFGKPVAAKSLIGKIAILDTASISPHFGGAVVKIPGKGDCSINVRSYQALEGVKRGDALLILEYDPEKNVFYVEPFDEATLS